MSQRDRLSVEREIPLYTLKGVPDADISTHYITTQDKLGLSMLRFNRGDSSDAVLIIHGLTTSSDMFIMPEHYNLVRYLLDHGLSDVWTLDFRMSNRHPYNLLCHRYNMDEIAAFDYPAAIARIREHIGDRRLHVICHCLGSASFLMGLFGRSVEGITSVIANSAGLVLRVSPWALFKLYVAPFLAEYVLGHTYLYPNWGQDPRLTRGKILSKLVDLIHRECDVPACHMLSMMWGSGFPALYSHDNLLEVTHRRGGDLYGGTNVHYHRHVRAIVRAGRAIKFEPEDPRLAHLPNDYLQCVEDITTPVLFVTGRNNKVFTDSNIVTHRLLERRVPGRHQLHVFPRYGHQDVFMGKSVHADIFPRFLQFIEEQRRVARARPSVRLPPESPGSVAEQAPPRSAQDPGETLRH